MEYVKIIPEMTSNNTPSPFVASASSQLATYAPVYAFQSGTSAWITDVANSYLQIDLGKPYRVEKVYFDSKNGWTNARVLTFELHASNDLAVWDLLEDTNTSATYDFEGVKKYGEYRYWRLVCKSMTMRGGAIGQFQLFKSKFNGDYDFEEPELMISEGKKDTFIGYIRPDVSGSIVVKINDNIVYTKDSITSMFDIEVPYSADDLRMGANKITVVMTDETNATAILDYPVFKLSKSASVQQPASYQFAIKNSPTYPQNDGWIGQVYNFDYLNSEHGVSYMFRYKPYAQVDARYEHRPSFAEKVDTKNATHVFHNIFSERVLDGTSGITLDLKKADVSTIRRAVHWDGYRLGFEEAGLVNIALYAWAIIDKEDVGIISRAELAMKRDKITTNLLKSSNIYGHRNKELINTLSLMNAYVTSIRDDQKGIVDYYKLFENIHPYRDTIVALGYINAITMDKIVNYVNLERIAQVRDLETVSSMEPYLGSKEEIFGIKGEYLNSELLRPLKDSISIYQEVAYRIDRYGHKYPYSTLVNSTENIGIKEVFLNASVDDRRGIMIELLNVDKNLDSRRVYLTELFTMDKTIEVRQGIMSNMSLIDTLDSDALITHLHTNVTLMPSDALVEKVLSNVLLMGIETYVYSDDIKKLTKLPKESNNIQNNTTYTDFISLEANNLMATSRFLEKLNKSSWSVPNNNMKVDIMPIDAGVFNKLSVFDKLSKDSDDVSSGFMLFDKLSKDIRFDTSIMFISKDSSKEGFELYDMTRVDNVGKEVNVITYDIYTDSTEKDAFDFSKTLEFVDKSTKGVMIKELDVLVNKIAKEVFKQELMTNIDSVAKISAILESWSFFTRISSEAREYEDAAIQFIKEERKGMEVEDKVALRRLKDTFLIEQLALDYVHLDAYINQLAGNFERVEQFEASKLLEILSDKAKSLAFISESIEAHRENVEKEAIIQERVLLVGDESEWQDIWDRYSPGVDVLDPPDDDYDYSKLTPKVYDEVTGRPLHPIGATNKANVTVGMPLTHPIPEHNEVGVDETKRIAVDNYIFIDTVLALESIKNRNKLRYAGMPAGKTMREVFSQLYTWIQQAAPGHEEYERMFRFARWYAEAVTIRQSKFILERVYNPWLSSLHLGAGLGTTHVQAGWFYNTVSNTLDTTTAAAHLEFTKETMVDGQFILRGYFDNPLSHGTIEISVDGVVVDTFTSHGVFKREVEVPQGHHTFRIDFVGAGSHVSISTIEITGVQFVSATTVADDSDTNGLKALNELMSQLLGYFELHHGGGKIKGTMEIRQRAVWNTHT